MKTGVIAILLSLLAALPQDAPQEQDDIVALGTIPAQQITWLQANIDPTTAQVSYTYKLTIMEEGNANPKVVSLLNVLCGGIAPSSNCSAPLPIPAAQSAIITGNSSTLTATDTRTGLASDQSIAFKGDQGCIFRNGLYKVSENTSVETRKASMNALLAEFQKAKFKHVSTKQLGGNRFLVTEQCVGYLVK